jgi:hypothetical protein
MKIEFWPIDKLTPYDRNARKLSDAAIEKVAASIREFGWRQPIVVDGAGVIIAGHTRLLAAKHLRLTEVPVHVAAGLTPAQVKAYRLMDNRSHEESGWDYEKLSAELFDLDALEIDMKLTGFGDDELAELMVEKTVGLTDDDEVPEAPVEPVSQMGDVWILGKHRMLCGDSTDRSAVEQLLRSDDIDLVLTDPPYGLNIVKTRGSSDEGVVGGGKPYGSNDRGVVGGGGSGAAMYPYGGVKKGVVGGEGIIRPSLYSPMINDDSTDSAQRFYVTAVAIGLKNFIIFGGNFFTAFLPSSRCWIVWDKQNSGNFADVEIAWTSFDKACRLYQWMWNGLSRAGDRNSELATRVHPTQKPVGLFEKIFADFKFGICFDGFLGSGSTLIACEKTGRACYGMELAPAYCDVIITRWQNFTGREATLDGRTFAQVKETRLTVAA